MHARIFAGLLTSALFAFGIAARAADTTTVFNEGMYHPRGTADTEWIELRNEMAVNMDLSGWRITGGVNFTFPANTTIAAGGYLVVAANPVALPGVSGVLGPWTGSLDNGGETIELKNAIGRQMDVFSYTAAGRFPAAADGGGVSLAKRGSGMVSGDAQNWTYSGQVGGSPGAENFPGGATLGAATSLVGYGATWNFNQAGTNLGATWAQTNFTAGVGGWLNGAGVFAFESDPVALPVGTVLADPGAAVITHYFQTTFNFTGNVAQSVLELSTLLDDGAVVWLNGHELTRINMPTGTVIGTTRAKIAVNNATVSSPFTLPTQWLVNGSNVLSVDVHAVGGSTSPGLTLASGAGFTMTWDGLSGANFGGPVPANFANAVGATAFSSSDLGPLISVPYHRAFNINDGRYGNSNSWISGGGANQYIGVKFGAAVPFNRIAWGRDNLGAFTDRSLGGYTVQYTTVANPGTATADTQNAATGWKTLGTATYVADAAFAPPLRHEFTFVPTGGGLITATAVRIKVTDNGSCLDELEVTGAAPNDVVFGAQFAVREVLPAPGTSALVINEISGSTDATWRVELRNTGGATLDLSAYAIAASNASAGLALSGTLAPGALLVLDQTQLGFRPALDDRVFLYNTARTALLDAATVKTTVRARNGSEFLTPTVATFGVANTFSLTSDIVINEVMYHFPPNSSTPALPVTANPEEWIELYNKGAAQVSLAGWTLDDAVSFIFPPGTTIDPGAYLVVAKDAAALAAKWPEQNTRIIGNFSGSLSNSGERIALKDASGNPADETRYDHGGAWPETPDGGGASMELRDARADKSVGSAWAASDESGDTAWQNVSYTIVAGQTFGQTQWNEFRLGLLDTGECLVDDVSVVRVSNAQQLIQGGNFESLTNKWRLLGNHGTSAIETEPGSPGNHVLHIRSSGAFGWNHNHLETSYVANTALVDGQSYTVSFRARWLSGTNQLNSRAYYSRLARTTELPLPTRIGTPGAVNSRAVANLGPTLSRLVHSPVIPNASEPVTVSAIASDPDGLASLTLRYALNGSASFASVAMTPSGSTYSAQIPGQVAGTIVQFYLAAADSLAAVSTLPAAGASSRALYIVNDGAGTTLSAYELRVIMLPADSTNLLAALNRMSDARIGGTAIYRRGEVFYDVGVRLQGTAAGRIRDGDDYVGFDVGFPADHLFRGLQSNVNIDRSGRAPVNRQQDEIYAQHMFHRAGVPCQISDLVYFIAPVSTYNGTALLQMSGYGGAFLDSQFSGDGTVFNLDVTYEPSTTTDGNFESLKNPVPLAGHVSSDFTNLGTDKEQYRGQLDPRAGSRADDYSGLIPFCQAMGDAGPNFETNIAARMDVDEWMRCAALYSLLGIGDCYMNAGLPHNLRVHVPSDGRKVSALPWDMDFLFSAGATSPPILAGGNLARVINRVPGARHAYYGHLHDICQTVFNSAYLTPWLSHYGSVVGQNFAGSASYIEARRTSVLSQLPPNAAFAITTNGGADFSVNASTAALSGAGWINVREIRSSDTGAALDLIWTNDTTWTTNVAVNFGPNLLTLSAYDFQGAVVGSDTITITSTLPAPAPRDFLRITEVHYNPANPATPAELAISADNDEFEFIELRNTGVQTLNLSGCKFTTGVDLTIPPGTTLAAGESIVAVRNVAAFRARYGSGPRVISTAYGPADSLSNSGETITLVDATGAIIQSFTYSDAWFPLTDGPGRSLVVRDESAATSAWNGAGQWAASITIGGTPGSSNAGQIGTQYDGWRFTYFSPTDLANPAICSPLASTDGVKNALRYALGYYAPHQPTAALTVIGSDGTFLTITYRRTKNALDATFTIEGTPDLATWTAIAAPPTPTIDNGDGTETLTVHDTVPISSNSKRHLRVRVTLQP